MASVINQIKLGSIEYAIAASAYGYCETTADAQTKTVNITTDKDTTNNSFTLVTGVSINVKFKYTNTAIDPKLDVANSGAKPIYYKGSTIPSSYLKAECTYTFVYTENIFGAGKWEIVGETGALDAAVITDDILDGENSGTQITYKPYTSQQSKLSFDTSSTNPTRNDRLNLNGYLYGTKLYSGGDEVLTAHPSITTETDTTSTASPSHGGTFTTIDSITRDLNGHVTKVNTKTITLPNSGNSDYRASSYNTSSKIFLIGATSQGSSTTTGMTTYSHDTAYVGTDGCLYSGGSKVLTSYTDTKNTAGSTDTSSKIYLIGATSQAANPQTYSHDTAYVGTDGCLYSGGSKVLTAHPSITTNTDTTSAGTLSHSGTFTAIDSVTRDSNGHVTKVNTKTYTLPSNSDTKVTQAYSTASNSYPLLMSATSGVSSTSTRGETTAIVNNQLYANPSTGSLSAKIIYLADSSNPYIKLQDNTTNSTPYYLQVSNNVLGFGPTFASAAKFDKDGNLTLAASNSVMTAKTFVATSDKRLKENIKPYSCEKSILELPIYTYNFIADETKTKHIGCMAQDLQEICPELIREDSEGYLSINESKIVYLLLDEVKKLKAEIEELNAKK